MQNNKKTLLLLAFSFITGINETKCQLVKELLNNVRPEKKFHGTPILQKKSQIVYFGIGAPNNVATLISITDYIPLFFGGTTTTYGKVGPVIAGYEYFIKEDISLGVNFGYAKAGKKYENGSTKYNAELTAYTIALSSSYHVYTTDKFDPYIKGAIGLNLWTSKESGIKIPIPTPFSYNALVGLRYFATQKLAPFGELGYSSLKFSANFGVALKIK